MCGGSSGDYISPVHIKELDNLTDPITGLGAVDPILQGDINPIGQTTPQTQQKMPAEWRGVDTELNKYVPFIAAAIATFGASSAGAAGAEGATATGATGATTATGAVAAEGTATGATVGSEAVVGSAGADTISAGAAAETGVDASTGAFAGQAEGGGTLGGATGTTGGTTLGSALKMAATVAPIISAASSLAAADAASKQAKAAQALTPQTASAPPASQQAVDPDLSLIRKRNALLFGLDSPSSTDLTLGKAEMGNLGRATLLGGSSKGLGT